VRFVLTGGQRGDCPQAHALIEGLPAEVVMADTAYDADPLRQAIAAKGDAAVMPRSISLSAADEAIIVAFRRHTLLPIFH
jgi:transposase